DYNRIELPILMMAAVSRLSDLHSSFEMGVNDFLLKPVAFEDLKTRTASLLSIKKSAREQLNESLAYHYGQISQHFLYNTLNAIIGLSYTDPEKTREALN